MTRSPAEVTSFLERQEAAVRDDHVVEHADAEEFAGALQAPRELPVLR